MVYLGGIMKLIITRFLSKNDKHSWMFTLTSKQISCEGKPGNLEPGCVILDLGLPHGRHVCFLLIDGNICYGKLILCQALSACSTGETNTFCITVCALLLLLSWLNWQSASGGPRDLLSVAFYPPYFKFEWVSCWRRELSCASVCRLCVERESGKEGLGEENLSALFVFKAMRANVEWELAEKCLCGMGKAGWQNLVTQLLGFSVNWAELCPVI